MQQDYIISNLQYCTSSLDSYTHYHNEYEILLICSGKIEITVNNRRYIARGGNIIFISNYENHSVKVLSGPYHRYYAILNPPIMDALINNPLFISIFKNRPVDFIHCMDISEQAAQITDIFQRMGKEYANKGKSSNDLMACYVKELLILLLRMHKRFFPYVKESAKVDIFEIQKYIDAHYAENLKISSIAERFYINSYYLSHLFKHQTGYSPQRYLLLTRLSCARELLQTTDQTVQSIAFQCGFQDVNNFIRVFKREFETTPKKYRGVLRTRQGKAVSEK